MCYRTSCWWSNDICRATLQHRLKYITSIGVQTIDIYEQTEEFVTVEILEKKVFVNKFSQFVFITAVTYIFIDLAMVSFSL